MKRLLYALSVLLCACQGNAQSTTPNVITHKVSFANERTDTTRINELLKSVKAMNLPTPGDAVVAFGEQFIGKPYKAATLEGDVEMLRVNIDSVDCTTFVEMMMAMAITIDNNRTSWRDFTNTLRQLRYRRGEIDGYPSRLHYISDWAADNVHRGNFIDATPLFPSHGYIVKTIDFMSKNASKYQALSDSANLAGIQNVEIGYRSHRYPYIKTSNLASKDNKSEYRNGDILAFTCNISNLDVSHMGILVMKNGEPYVMHASLSAGKVVVSDLPLADFVKKNRGFTGVRIFRLKDQ